MHGEDIRRVVGLRRDYPDKAVARSLLQQARMPASFGGAKELVARVRLTASDVDLSVGEGPEVSGPALALLLAVTGRRIALDELDGPGLATLLPRTGPESDFLGDEKCLSRRYDGYCCACSPIEKNTRRWRGALSLT